MTWLVAFVATYQVNSWTWFKEWYAPRNSLAIRLRFLSSVFWKETGTGDESLLDQWLWKPKLLMAWTIPVQEAAMCATAARAACFSPTAEKVAACHFLALQELGRSCMQLWQMYLAAVSTRLPCIFRACLEYLAPEICFGFCSEKAYQMCLLAAL